MRLAIFFFAKAGIYELIDSLREELKSDDNEVFLITEPIENEIHDDHLIDIRSFNGRLDSWNFDVILSLSDRLPGDLISRSRYGIWTFDFLFLDDLNGKVIFIKNLLKNIPYYEIKLVCLRANNQCFSLEEISVPVNLNLGFGVPTMLEVLKICLPYFRRNINLLKKIDNEIFKYEYSANLVKETISLTNWEKCIFGYKVFKSKLSRLFFYHWNIGVIESNLFDSVGDGFVKISWLNHNNKNHTYADPFLFRREGRTYVFFEDIDLFKYKGEICVSEYSQGKWSKPVPVITKDYTVSFPSIFEFNNKIYCLPEARASGKTILFEAEVFPYRWKEKKELFINIAAVDPQIIFYDNLYWLFLSKNDFGRWHQLFVYYTNDPLSEWQAHELNPVKSDVHSARNAGRIFLHEGKLFRPSMDNSRIYGEKIIINEIVTLSKSDYTEKEVLLIDKNMYPVKSAKTHTISTFEGYTVIDSAVKVLSIFNCALVKRKLINIFNSKCRTI